MMKIPYHRSTHRPAQALRMLVALAGGLVAAGCANNEAPTEQMAVARAEISHANGAGAGEFAPVPYKSAMDKMDMAEQALANKDYDLARRMAEEADVDAKLAAATARSAKARKAADAVQEDIRVLRQEIDRKTP